MVITKFEEQHNKMFCIYMDFEYSLLIFYFFRQKRGVANKYKLCNLLQNMDLFLGQNIKIWTQVNCPGYN